MIFNSAPTFPVGTTRYEVWREDKTGRWNFEQDFTNNEAARLFIEDRLAFGYFSNFKILKTARMSPEVQVEMKDHPIKSKPPTVADAGVPIATHKALLSITEAANLCGVSRVTFYALMKRGMFQECYISDRTRRITRSSIDEYLKSRKIPA